MQSVEVLNIFFNNSLTSLNGLESLTSIHSLRMNTWENLQDFSALDGNITSLENLELYQYKKSSFPELSSLTSIGDIKINNSELTNLDFLSQITTINRKCRNIR